MLYDNLKSFIDEINFMRDDKAVKHKQSKWIIYYAIIANAIGMMSMDIYLPVLSEIAEELDTSFFASQLILIVFYVIGIIARITLGPLSDSFGRRKVMLLALDIHIIGQALQSFATNIEILLIGRVVQALASGVLTILISAIISDMYIGAKRTKMLSVNEFVQPLSFVIAPLIGGYLAMYYGWRAGFYFLLINLVLARIILGIFMRETNFKLRQASFGNMLRGYTDIVYCSRFMAYNMIMAFIVSAYMLYAVSSSHIYMVRFGMEIRDYMLYQSLPLIVQSCIAFGYDKMPFGLNRMVEIGVATICIAAFIASLVISGVIPFAPITVLCNVILICISLGFVFPACMKFALDIFPDTKGTAASTIVVSRGILCGITMSIIGYYVEYQYMFMWGWIIMAALTFIIWYLLRFKVKY